MGWGVAFVADGNRIPNNCDLIFIQPVVAIDQRIEFRIETNGEVRSLVHEVVTRKLQTVRFVFLDQLLNFSADSPDFCCGLFDYRFRFLAAESVFPGNWKGEAKKFIDLNFRTFGGE